VSTRALLAGTGLSAATMIGCFGIYFFAVEHALAFPNGWVLVAVSYATVVAIAAVTRRWLVLVTGGVGGTFATFVVFVMLLFTHAGNGHPGVPFAIVGLVVAIPSVWLLARARGWMRASAPLVVPVALAVWSTVPRKVVREPPGRDVIQKLATDDIKAEGGPVEVVAFELGAITTEHYIAGEGRVFHWTATIEMTADGYWNLCPDEHTRTGYTREPMKNPDGWTPCMNTPHPKGERFPHAGTTTFTFEQGIGWVGPDHVVH
jgi:hypothetical protein